VLLVAASIFAVSGPISPWLAGRRQAGAEAAVDDRADKSMDHDAEEVRGPRLAPVFVATMLVCFYIGYFGAGAGFLIITALSLFGFTDLNEINALKVVSTTMANGMAFIIFVVSGQVVWKYCLLAMVTCAVGGYMSARFARLVPQAVLRGTVIVIGFGMAAWFFWKG
jgi:uncharacterized membrane protein YfcA